MATLTLNINDKLLKGGFVVLDAQEYRKIQMNSAPTYCLTGAKAEELDKLVEEGLREHAGGKTKRIKSLADLR